MKQAIQFVKDNHIKHLLVETSVDKKSMNSLSEETGKSIYEKYLQIQLEKKDRKEIHIIK